VNGVPQQEGPAANGFLASVVSAAADSPCAVVAPQVLGHSKTILVLLGGWAFLGDQISGRQFAGMVLAVLGMVGYGVASSQ
jgi:multidrug transporter EmrE-like cation transporter